MITAPGPNNTERALTTLPEPPGARLMDDGRTRFRVWFPEDRSIALVLRPSTDQERVVAFGAADERGIRRLDVDDAPAGTRYLLRLEDGAGSADLPDPASRGLPEGVHGPSAVVDLTFEWSDPGWTGPRRQDLVFYELHVGTFTREGTFDAVIPELPRLARLGVTALEIMPVTQFPGSRNWGYDGVQPFAVHPAYGGPAGLQRLVDAAHGAGLGVFADVVYNHLGPEGAYLSRFGPYFTEAYATPWGAALNFDGAGSDEVRRYFIDHALELIGRYHIDGLRLDAIQTIFDRSTYPFLEQLADEVRELGERLGRRVHLIGETDTNDTRLVLPGSTGGVGLDGIWADDLHHALHAAVTGERTGYYMDFGRIEDLARAYRTGFAYAGRRSAFRGRRHGRSPDGAGPARFVVCSQNHDQVGNRMQGERLAALTDLDTAAMAAAVVVLSPQLPLLFMGEEWGETAPFQYFVSHGDPALVEAVRKGRAAEFAEFLWQGSPPDPQAEETFEGSRIDRGKRDDPAHARLEALYEALLGVRRRLPLFDAVVETAVSETPPAFLARFTPPDSPGPTYALVVNLADEDAALPFPLPATLEGRWTPVLDTAAFPEVGLAPLDARGLTLLERPRRSALLLRAG